MGWRWTTGRLRRSARRLWRGLLSLLPWSTEPLHAVILGTYWDTLTSLTLIYISISCLFCVHLHWIHTVLKSKVLLFFKPSWLIRIDLLSEKNIHVLFVLRLHQFWYSKLLVSGKHSQLKLVPFFEKVCKLP